MFKCSLPCARYPVHEINSNMSTENIDNIMICEKISAILPVTGGWSKCTVIHSQPWSLKSMKTCLLNV